MKLPSFGMFVRRRIRRPSRRKEYLEHKEAARALILERLAFFCSIYGLTYNKVAIRNQRSRWGSCSSKRNLNFNYRIIFLPQELQDYVIVHEVCHLAHLNHGPHFWTLVAETIPEYARLRRELRRHKF